MALDVRRLGRTRYEDVHALQRELVERRAAGEAPDTLLLTEHEPVITVGRGGDPLPAEIAGVPVVQVERGGEATWHGPGQLVLYPILLLPEGRRDLHRYLRDLEEVAIRVLAEVGLAGTRRPGLTGVWLGERKIASIGVAVRRWVTWHGLSLNVSCDLKAFAGFRPCGLEPDSMTRVADHAELHAGLLLFEVLAVRHAVEVLDLRLPPPAPPPPPSGGASELPILPS